MAEKKIKIPSDVDSMRVQHLHFLLQLKRFEDKEPTNPDIVRMVASFTGLDTNFLSRVPMVDNKRIFNEIVLSFGTYKPKDELPDFLEYEGTRYTKRGDFTKLPTAWYIDYSVIDFEIDPIDMISLLYIEEGMSYGEQDEHNNIINKRADRNKVFSEHLPLSTYLNVEGFFLKRWNVLQPLLIKAQNLSKRRIPLP